MLDRPYPKRWPLDRDKIGMVDRAPPDFPMRPELLEQFESLGDNCEFGFVQRFHGAEPSSLFRWATAPLHGVLRGLEDGWADIYSWEHLKPWAFDMAWDDKYQCAFHCAVHCSRSSEDEPFEFVLPEVERRAVWEADRPKFIHLRDKTIASLKTGNKIYVAKANAGLTLSDCLALKAALDRYFPHRLLCVVPASTSEFEGVTLIKPGLKLATISQLASYHRVELAAYGEWTNLLQKAVDTPWS